MEHRPVFTADEYALWSLVMNFKKITVHVEIKFSAAKMQSCRRNV